jgi:hypothetical protein
LNVKRIAKVSGAWIATFLVAFVAWYVMNYTNYPELALLIVAAGILPIGAVACWQTVPRKKDRTERN